jgi:hypothetical protein
MPTIAVSSQRREDVFRAFMEWQKEHGGAIQTLPPMSTMPDGRDVYVMVSYALVEELVQHSIPYDQIAG